MKQNRGSALRTVAVLALCAVFFVLAMGVTLLGSGIYRGTVSASDENYTHRTALSYLANQIRRGDVAGGVAVGSFEGADAIVLTDGDYVTYLYCWDGQLRELYMEAGTGLTAADGVPVLPLASLTVTLVGNCIALTVID
ncbi:MAG TPA: DUF4860 domain-containing protein, partial [Armatimonadota bacterium]|nr:DUF4860 domain-containing protein [Armatimonadota bacterium]